MTRPKIGDLIEIRTSRGLAYALYSHQHGEFGALLRVFAHPYEKRPEQLADILAGKIQFETFFPLTAAIRRSLVEIAGHVGVPSRFKAFPIFRDGIADPKTKKVDDWWFWDGKKEWKVGKITPAERRFPLRAVWNDTLLRKRFEEGWTPENDSR